MNFQVTYISCVIPRLLALEAVNVNGADSSFDTGAGPNVRGLN